MGMNMEERQINPAFKKWSNLEGTFTDSWNTLVCKVAPMIRNIFWRVVSTECTFQFPMGAFFYRLFFLNWLLLLLSHSTFQKKSVLLSNFFKLKNLLFLFPIFTILFCFHPIRTHLKNCYQLFDIWFRGGHHREGHLDPRHHLRGDA